MDIDIKYYNTNIRRYLVKYGTEMTNHVMEMVNSLSGETSYNFYKDFEYFYYLFPKINFYNKREITELFMDEFDKSHKEYLRIKKIFEYISSSLCGIRKKFEDVDYILEKMFEDLEGFDRTGEVYEI